MRIIVEKLLGDATVYIYNKSGELIYSEGFYGFNRGNSEDNSYIRNIPVAEIEYGYSKALFDKEFEYKVVA